jgi:hypothetical protein
VGVVLLDEGIAENEGVAELRRQVQGHHAEGALGLSESGDLRLQNRAYLEDVLARSQDIVLSSDDEGEIGVRVEGITVDDLGVGPVGEDLIDDGLGTNDDGGTSVNLIFSKSFLRFP